MTDTMHTPAKPTSKIYGLWELYADDGELISTRTNIVTNDGLNAVGGEKFAPGPLYLAVNQFHQTITKAAPKGSTSLVVDGTPLKPGDTQIGVGSDILGDLEVLTVSAYDPATKTYTVSATSFDHPAGEIFYRMPAVIDTIADISGPFDFDPAPTIVGKWKQQDSIVQQSDGVWVTTFSFSATQLRNIVSSAGLTNTDNYNTGPNQSTPPGSLLYTHAYLGWDLTAETRPLTLTITLTAKNG